MNKAEFEAAVAAAVVLLEPSYNLWQSYCIMKKYDCCFKNGGMPNLFRIFNS